MTEHPILFSGDMVNAILSGRKTQTRRPVRGKRAWPAMPYGASPFGVAGDRLWVRENWSCRIGDYDAGDPLWVLYPSDNIFRRINPDSVQWEKWVDKPGTIPSIHMPRWASRTNLLVAEVRVERVQDITIVDVLAEGMTKCTKDNGATWKYGMADSDGLPGTDDYGWPWADWIVDPILAYRKLWDSLYDKAWDDNPWVWAATFSLEGK